MSSIAVAWQLMKVELAALPREAIDLILSMSVRCTLITITRPLLLVDPLCVPSGTDSVPTTVAFAALWTVILDASNVVRRTGSVNVSDRVDALASKDAAKRLGDLASAETANAALADSTGTAWTALSSMSAIVPLVSDKKVLLVFKPRVSKSLI